MENLTLKVLMQEEQQRKPLSNLHNKLAQRMTGLGARVIVSEQILLKATKNRKL